MPDNAWQRMPVVWVTGANRGVGWASVQLLKQRGYGVIAGVRHKDAAHDLEALGVRTVQLDMSCALSRQRAVAEVLEQTDGRLFALFNNAGYALPGAVEDLTLEGIRAQFETNVFGPCDLICQLLPNMRAQGEGRIINHTSILGTVNMPFRGAYNASKAALDFFTDSLRQELLGSRIHVSALASGPIETTFRLSAMQAFERWHGERHSFFNDRYALMRRQVGAVSRMGIVLMRPEKVAKVFLKALESPRPSGRYYVGIASKTLAVLHRLLPTSLMDRCVIALAKMGE